VGLYGLRGDHMCERAELVPLLALLLGLSAQHLWVWRSNLQCCSSHQPITSARRAGMFVI
jgi:hypothetical protein